MPQKNKSREELISEIKKLKKKLYDSVISIPGVAVINKYERALSESEEKLRVIFENASETVMLVSLSGLVLRINHGIFDYPKERYLNKSAYRIIPQKEFNWVLKNKKKKEYECSGISSSGSHYWQTIRISPIIEKKQIANFIVSIFDTTEQKLAEEKTKEAEERFRKLSDSTFEGVVIHANGIIIEANKAFSKIFGYARKELIGKNAIMFATPQSQKLIKQKIKDKNEDPYEAEGQTKKGKRLAVLLLGKQIIYKNKPARVTVVRDITSEKQNELLLRESEERFRLLSDSAMEGIVLSENGKIIDANDRFLEMHGYKNLKEVIGKTFFHFAPKEDHLKIKKALAKSESESHEISSIKKDGTIIYVETRGRNIPFKGRTIRVSVAIDITQRKLNETELEQSREDYKSLVEASPNGVFIHDEKGKVLYANPAALSIVNAKSLKSVAGKSVFDFSHPNYIDAIKKRGDALKKTTHPPLLESQIITKTGEIKDVESRLIPITYRGKKAIQVIINDITAERKLEKEKIRAEVAETSAIGLQKEIEERKKAEEKYRDIFENATDFIQSVDMKGNILYVNNAWRTTLGYSDKEISSKNIFEFIHPDSKQHCLSVFQSIATQGDGANQMEVEFISKLGKKVITEGSISVKTVDGKPESTRGIFRDITEKKRVEEALRIQSEKLNAVVDNSSFTVWALDKNYQFTAFNNYFSDVTSHIYGIKPQVGMSVNSLLANSKTEEHKNLWLTKYKEVFSGKTVHFQAIVEDTKGVIRWREFYLKPVYGLKGEVVEITGMGQDITEKKQNEEKIKQSLLEKEMLIKEVHHRVKNNLQVISSILNLQSSYAKDEATLNLLRESQNRIKSMAFIHESLYQSKDLTKINFTEYITTLSQSLVHSYTSPHHKILLELDVEQAFLNLDTAIPCGLILNELVSNALKYAFFGLDKGRIKIALSKKQDEISIAVSDNGVGFPSDINFKNSPSLGLQLVNTLVEQINGKIEQKNNKGTEYIITFKLQNNTNLNVENKHISS